MVNAKKYAKAWRKKRLNGSHDPNKEGEDLPTLMAEEIDDLESGYIDPDDLENG